MHAYLYESREGLNRLVYLVLSISPAHGMMLSFLLDTLMLLPAVLQGRQRAALPVCS